MTTDVVVLSCLDGLDTHFGNRRIDDSSPKLELGKNADFGDSG